MNLDLKHPAELNALQIYRQTKKLVKHTSRARDADWYRGAFELDRQWHLWCDGDSVVSAVYDRRGGKWREGPSLPEFFDAPGGGIAVSLNPPEAVAELHETVKALLRGKELDLDGKVKSLGVVLHLAGDFSISDIASEYAGDDDFAAVNELLTLEPQIALGDPNADVLASSWRALPYWGVVEGERRSAAVQVSREYAALIAELRHWGESNNIPVIASAVSAPLEILRLAPHFLEWSPSVGDLILFQYRKFSAFVALGVSGELMMVRALPHVGERRHPARFGDTLVSTAASMNFAAPRVHIVPLCNEGTNDLIAELGQFFSSRAAMDIGVIDLGDIKTLDELPGRRPEMLLADVEKLGEDPDEAPLLDNDTFTHLAEGWATMDFYGLSAYQQEVYPERKDLKLLTIANKVKLLLLVLSLGLGGWTGWEYIRVANTEAWKLDQAAAESAKLTLQTLGKQNSEATYWENIMLPRSEGWLVLELLLDLFPAESGIIVTDCSYRVAGAPAEKDAAKVGFDRVWSIKGFARSEGVPMLGKLSSNNYLAEQFVRIAEGFDNESLRSSPETRTLHSTMQQKQGELPASVGLPASVARHYRTSFELTIEQNFGSKDVLALTAKPPF